MTETNKRIYYILMGVTASVAALIVTACIVIADYQIFYAMGLAIPAGLVIGLIGMMMYVYPTLQPDQPKRHRRKRRTPYVPDPMGLRWITAGTVTLGSALVMLCIALLVMQALPLWGGIALTLLLLAAIYGVDIYITNRIYHIAGQTPNRSIALTVLEEAVDIIMDFFV